MWELFVLEHPVTGTGYDVQAKVYGEPSIDYGINGGRISKLAITDLDAGEIVYCYDRGLDKDCADQEARDILEHVLEMYK